MLVGTCDDGGSSVDEIMVFVVFVVLQCMDMLMANRTLLISSSSLLINAHLGRVPLQHDPLHASKLSRQRLVLLLQQHEGLETEVCGRRGAVGLGKDVRSRKERG